MKVKKLAIMMMLSTLFMTACTTSVGVGTGFHLGGLGIGVSTSAPLKKEKTKTTDEIVEKALKNTKNEEKGK